MGLIFSLVYVFFKNESVALGTCLKVFINLLMFLDDWRYLRFTILNTIRNIELFT